MTRAARRRFAAAKIAGILRVSLYTVRHELNRPPAARLGPWMATAIVIGTVIGSGVFKTIRCRQGCSRFRPRHARLGPRRRPRHARASLSPRSPRSFPKLAATMSSFAKVTAASPASSGAGSSSGSFAPAPSPPSPPSFRNPFTTPSARLAICPPASKSSPSGPARQ